MDRRGERGQATRQHIVGVATGLFAGQGYEATSIEAVLRACGISRGALYHHFAGKEALFTAVLQAEEQRVAAAVAAAGREAGNPLDALRAGCAAWLRLAAGDAAVRRIVLQDAPGVLGWARWREIDNQCGLGLLKAGLGMAAAAGRLRPEQVEPYAHALLAVLIEMAMLVARAAAADDAMLEGQRVVERVLAGLFGLAPQAPGHAEGPLPPPA